MVSRVVSPVVTRWGLDSLTHADFTGRAAIESTDPHLRYLAVACQDVADDAAASTKDVHSRAQGRGNAASTKRNFGGVPPEFHLHAGTDTLAISA